MNFPVEGKKATQAVARLITRSGGPIDYLRISKLIYLADRESILKRRVPIVGGHYYSMARGPTISEVMSFVHTRKAPEWKETISPRFGNEVRLQGTPRFGALSKAELDILDSVVKFHSNRTTDELVQWCHVNCPEYQHVDRGRKPIQVEAILKAAKKTAKQIQKVVQEAKCVEELDALLT